MIKAIFVMCARLARYGFSALITLAFWWVSQALVIPFAAHHGTVTESKALPLALAPANGTRK